MSRPLRLYLAGPEVFRPDAAAEGERLAALCREAGAEGLFPLHADGVDIRQACIDMIEEADALVANISPFRGIHMDPGTAFEVGYAEARGKPVFLWSDDLRSLVERIPAGADGRDREGNFVEDGGRSENLMIVDGRRVWRTPEEAIAEAITGLAFTMKNRELQRMARSYIVLALAVSLFVALAAGFLVNRLVGW